MKFKYLYITKEPEIAKLASESGVDRIFVDMEYLGKDERQKGLDTVKSHHTLEDLRNIRKTIKSDILVRINPINEYSEEEINGAIENGANYLMLPMFKDAKTVETFIKYVDGRCKTVLLFEHIDAVKNADEILAVRGIDEVHIGLNDLHLSMKLTFMFETLTNGIVRELCEKLKAANIPFGIGGIANLGGGKIPAEMIVSEIYRLGATATILSRGFISRDEMLIKNEFKRRIDAVNMFVEDFEGKSESYFDENYLELSRKVEEIVDSTKL